jgi:4'-phosphopantetheinyl transferase
MAEAASYGSLGLAGLADAVDIWTAEVWEFQNPEAVKLFLSWLSSDEQRRLKRYIRPRDRELFLYAHSLLRHTLSQYCDVDPAEWEFENGEHGRPELSGRFTSFGLRFNLSHTPGVVACLVSDAADAGVDVEGCDAAADPLKLAGNVFSEREFADLSKLSGAEMNQRFYEIWTLKEAYIKARGMGLALPLKGFTFTFEGSGPISISFDSSIDDDPAVWQFQHWRPGDKHQGAVALRRGSRHDRQIAFRRGLALRCDSDNELAPAF